jgi:hypothetical protein
MKFKQSLKKLAEVEKILGGRKHNMTTKILIKNNGSIKVFGDFGVVDQSGNKFELYGRTKFHSAGADRAIISLFVIRLTKHAL